MTFRREYQGTWHDDKTLRIDLDQVTWIERQLEAARARVAALPRWRVEVFKRQLACEIELGYLEPLKTEEQQPLTKS